MKSIRDLIVSLLPLPRPSSDPVTIIDALYRKIDGGYVSHAERERLHINDTSFIYGEVLLPSFTDMLKIVQPAQGEIFYDLGSGVGKAVIFASLLYDWRKCVGIELLPGLFQVSQAVLANYSTIPKEQTASFRQTPVEFIEGDFLQIDFSDADVIHVNATTLNPVLWGDLLPKLNQLKSGVRVMVTTKKLDEAYFEKIYQDMLPMSWGDCTVFIYRRR